MDFKFQKGDPLQVLSSTKFIVEDLKYIKINEDKIHKISKVVSQKLAVGLDVAETHFGETDNLENAIQLIFLEDVVNFCFWAEKGMPKWQGEWPKELITSGGWYSSTKCVQRALAEKIPILDADYLANLNLEQ